MVTDPVEQIIMPRWRLSGIVPTVVPVTICTLPVVCTNAGAVLYLTSNWVCGMEEVNVS